jgi:hypothetical protein
MHTSQSSHQEPPKLSCEDDLRIAYEWFRAEKARLEAYTHGQFAAIHNQHQALLAKHVRSEEALAVRAQELNREIQFLASQSAALQKRSREMSDWEKALAAQTAKLSQTHEELEKAEKAVQRRLAELDDLEDRLRQELEAQERQQSRDRQELEVTRNRLMREAEEIVQRRLAEVDEMELRIRQELQNEARRPLLGRKGA